MVRQARGSGLLGRLAFILERLDLIQATPGPALRHLVWAQTIAAKHAVDVRWEIECIRAAMASRNLECILLKGAAYSAAGLPLAAGRLFADIDILVSRDRLAEAELALRTHGWQSTKVDPYDQHYYRRWMHELPPLRHVARGTVIDVHHTILPVTARPRIDVAKILARVCPAGDGSGLFVLALEDMILHAVAHTFYDGDFREGLRELVDLDSLLRGAAGDDVFWDRLTDRAGNLDLERPLWLALRLCAAILGTPVPGRIIVALEHAAPPALARRAMDVLLSRAVRPNHSSCERLDVRLSRFLLYIRSHYLRMPLRLLLPHLARKAAMGLTSARKRPA